MLRPRDGIGDEVHRHSLLARRASGSPWFPTSPRRRRTTRPSWSCSPARSLRCAGSRRRDRVRATGRHEAVDAECRAPTPIAGLAAGIDQHAGAGAIRRLDAAGRIGDADGGGQPARPDDLAHDDGLVEIAARRRQQRRRRRRLRWASSSRSRNQLAVAAPIVPLIASAGRPWPEPSRSALAISDDVRLGEKILVLPVGPGLRPRQVPIGADADAENQQDKERRSTVARPIAAGGDTAAAGGGCDRQARSGDRGPVGGLRTRFVRLTSWTVVRGITIHRRANTDATASADQQHDAKRWRDRSSGNAGRRMLQLMRERRRVLRCDRLGGGLGARRPAPARCPSRRPGSPR